MKNNMVFTCICSACFDDYEIPIDDRMSLRIGVELNFEFSLR